MEDLAGIHKRLSFGYVPVVGDQASGSLSKLKPKSSGVSSRNMLPGGHRVKLHTPRTTGRLRTCRIRIVSQELFDAAQSRKRARGHTHPNQQRRSRHMLLGLLRCGACGAGMSMNGKDNSGRVRIRCSAATESGSCQDAKTFYLKTVESAVLAGLENEMRHPRVIAEFVRTYHEERKRLSAKANANGLISNCGSANSIARLIGWLMR
jgi:hypothetical protein